MTPTASSHPAPALPPAGAPRPGRARRGPSDPNLRPGALLRPVPEDGGPRRIGTAAARARIADPVFTPDARIDFHVRFDQPEGDVAASGGGTLDRDDLPVRGILPALRYLRVVQAPGGSAGGAASGLSVIASMVQCASQLFGSGV